MSDTSSTNTSGTGILNRGKEVTFKKHLVTEFSYTSANKHYSREELVQPELKGDKEMLSDSNHLVHNTTENSYVFNVIFITLITNIPNSFLT